MGTREKLLETALAVFSERGSDGGSMREIARRAGVNVATTYHHFGGKRDLFLAVFRELGFIDTPEIGPIPTKKKDEALEQIILFSLVFLARGADVIRLAYTEALKGDPDVLEVFSVWQQQGDGRIEEALLEAKLANPSNSARRALTVRHMIWGTFTDSLVVAEIDLERFKTCARDAAASLIESWR